MLQERRLAAKSAGEEAQLRAALENLRAIRISGRDASLGGRPVAEAQH